MLVSGGAGIFSNLEGWWLESFPILLAIWDQTGDRDWQQKATVTENVTGRTWQQRGKWIPVSRRSRAKFLPIWAHQRGAFHERGQNGPWCFQCLTTSYNHDWFYQLLHSDVIDIMIFLMNYSWCLMMFPWFFSSSDDPTMSDDPTPPEILRCGPALWQLTCCCHKSATCGYCFWDFWAWWHDILLKNCCFTVVVDNP